MTHIGPGPTSRGVVQLDVGTLVAADKRRKHMENTWLCTPAFLRIPTYQVPTARSVECLPYAATRFGIHGRTALHDLRTLMLRIPNPASYADVLLINHCPAVSHSRGMAMVCPRFPGVGSGQCG